MSDATITIEAQVFIATEVDIDAGCVVRARVTGSPTLPTYWLNPGRRWLAEDDEHAVTASALLFRQFGEFDGFQLYPRLGEGLDVSEGWGLLLARGAARRRAAQLPDEDECTGAETGRIVSVEDEVVLITCLDLEAEVVTNLSLGSGGLIVPQFYAPDLDQTYPDYLPGEHPFAALAESIFAETLGPFPGGELFPGVFVWGSPGEGWFDLIHRGRAPLRRSERRTARS